MEGTVRKPYVAGKFYPGSVLEINNLMEQIKSDTLPGSPELAEASHIYGAILPHAGHIYSGRHVFPFFKLLRQRGQDVDTFIILHPIHRGGHIHYASDSNSYWSSPAGKLSVDHELREAMQVPVNETIHKWEHSAEVFLPFLHYFHFQDKQILPIGLCQQSEQIAFEIARKIIQGRKDTNRKILLLASSDFSHFVQPEFGYAQDQFAIDQIIRLNTKGFLAAVHRHKISMCGYGPVLALMHYCLMEDSNPQADLISRGHSGEVYPDDEVVDYVSILFHGLSGSASN